MCNSFNMKQLKSSLRDLRELFERSITIREIAEPFSSFDMTCSADGVKQFMNTKDYDVIGVRKDGLISGYARRNKLSGGKLEDYLISFDEQEKFPETTPIIKVMESFRSLDRIFITIFGEVGGIVTRGDLQKPPIRMWFFGLISLIEMQLLRIIRECYPSNGWEHLISKNRIDKASNEFDKRHGNNAAIDLIDCLQFCDKREIILKEDKISKKLNVNSNSCRNFLEKLEKLRNNLCHAQDIITENWPGIIDIAREAENFLHKCEEFKN